MSTFGNAADAYPAREPFVAPFAVRPFKEGDAQAINAWATYEDMGGLDSFENIIVAADALGEAAGFIRCFAIEGEWYVFPVVTHPLVRGYGVGRLLMDAAFKSFGPLKFVARGYAVPFYERLGCTEVLWSEIPDALVDDCSECPMLEECMPLPMRYDGPQGA